MTNEEINEICEQYNIINYTINNGVVDVDGSVIIYGKGLTKLPLNFNKVTGNFDCADNQLTTLEGCPHTVTENFWCSNNKLTSLEHSPVEVGGNFLCYNNKLRIT